MKYCSIRCARMLELECEHEVGLNGTPWYLKKTSAFFFPIFNPLFTFFESVIATSIFKGLPNGKYTCSTRNGCTIHIPDLSVFGKARDAPGLSSEKIFPFTLLSNTFSIFPEHFHSFKGFFPKNIKLPPFIRDKNKHSTMSDLGQRRITNPEE